MTIVEITAKPPLDDSLVEMLETMVSEAKEGKLLSIVGVYLNQSGENFNFTSVEVDDELKLLGCLDILKDEFKVEHLTDWEEYDE
jgi:hypothetical protein